MVFVVWLGVFGIRKRALGVRGWHFLIAQNLVNVRFGLCVLWSLVSVYGKHAAFLPGWPCALPPYDIPWVPTINGITKYYDVLPIQVILHHAWRRYPRVSGAQSHITPHNHKSYLKHQTPSVPDLILATPMCSPLLKNAHNWKTCSMTGYKVNRHCADDLYPWNNPKHFNSCYFLNMPCNSFVEFVEFGLDVWCRALASLNHILPWWRWSRPAIS